MIREIADAWNLLQIRPVYRKQQENFDRVLKCVTHLIYLLVSTAESDDEKKIVSILCDSLQQKQNQFISKTLQVKENVRKLVKNHIRSACTNDTLLHLCVSRLNVIKSGYFNDGTAVGVSTVVIVQISEFMNRFSLCRAFFQIIAL